MTRIVNSPFAADVRRHSYLIGLMLAAVLVIAVPIVTRGQYMTYGGLADLP